MPLATLERVRQILDEAQVKEARARGNVRVAHRPYTLLLSSVPEGYLNVDELASEYKGLVYRRCWYAAPELVISYAREIAWCSKALIILDDDKEFERMIKALDYFSAVSNPATLYDREYVRSADNRLVLVDLQYTKLQELLEAGAGKVPAEHLLTVFAAKDGRVTFTGQQLSDLLSVVWGKALAIADSQ